MAMTAWLILGGMALSGTSRRFSRPSVMSAVRSGVSSAMASSARFFETLSIDRSGPPMPDRPAGANAKRMVSLGWSPLRGIITSASRPIVNSPGTSEWGRCA